MKLYPLTLYNIVKCNTSKLSSFITPKITKMLTKVEKEGRKTQNCVNCACVKYYEGWSNNCNLWVHCYHPICSVLDNICPILEPVRELCKYYE